MNFFDPRIGNYNQKIWYIDPRSPLTIQNYKILFKKNPNVRQLNPIAIKIGSVPTKRNINRVLKARGITDPKLLTVKLKKKQIQNAINVNPLLRELQRLQERI